MGNRLKLWVLWLLRPRPLSQCTRPQWMRAIQHNRPCTCQVQEGVMQRCPKIGSHGRKNRSPRQGYLPEVQIPLPPDLPDRVLRLARSELVSRAGI